MPTLALVGNPNVGKTSMFNGLTGLRQQVGNWPGVTVERKEGELKVAGQKVNVVDLPGIYSLSASSEDARVARDYIINEKPDVLVNVVDATNLARNLYLTVQLLEMGANIVVALNFMDELEKSGLKVDAVRLEKLLGVPVVPTSAKTKEGLKELAKHALTAAHCRGRRLQPLKLHYADGVEEKIKELALPRWEALKRLETEEAGSDDYAAAIAQARYRFIEDVVRQVLVQTQDKDPLSLTDKIDRLVADSFWGIPLFFLVVWAVFQFTFKMGEPLVGLAQGLCGLAADYALRSMTELGVPDPLVSLVVSGLIPGVGSVISFTPNIFLLFFAISLLEDSGYMARAAHIADRFMSSMGLHGKAFIPMVLGFGCNVPGIMAARTLGNRRDRIITILLIPFMSCMARLPIYVLFAGTFFRDSQSLVILGLYALGVVLALLMGNLFGRLLFESEPSYFILELPPYRFPSIRVSVIRAWQKAAAFVNKAGTSITGAAALVWLLSNLPWGVPYASDSSVLGRIGRLIAPLLRPAGFGTWEAAAALIFGSMAKELVVSTLGIVYRAEGAALSQVIAQRWTPGNALSFMVMSLIYMPCVAVMATIKKETGSWKWAAFAAICSVSLGWLMAVLVFQGIRLLGLLPYGR
ncbi:MAG TPA: ferrous iron transport protein B [Firmicutes bacterium]|nr:ferrous iron transport protein B [Bacillota bacterium]